MRVNREKLYEEVWDEPMTKVAVRYRVSSNFLARVCDRLRVPKPPRGYWARLAAGEAMERPDLPAALPGDETEWVREPAWMQRRVAEERQRRDVPQRAQVRPKRKVRRPRSARPAMHELLVGARAHFESAPVPRESYFDRPGAEYLRPNKKLLLDLFVSKTTLDAGLLLANELFLSLEDRGHRVLIAPQGGPCRRPEVDERKEGGPERYGGSWRPVRPTVVFIGEVAIGLTIYEQSEEVEMRWVKDKLVRASEVPLPRGRSAESVPDWSRTKRHLPSGQFCIRASSPYQLAGWEKKWTEEKPGTLSGKISRIVLELEEAAPVIAKLVNEAAAKAEVEQRKWEEDCRRREIEEAERRRVQNIKDATADLHAVIEQYRVKVGIEAFFREAEQRAGLLPPDAATSVLDRLEKARALIGPIDALEALRNWQAPEERKSKSYY
jgi:hypothetical protein